ncbi:hypothetical protein HWQ46_26765 [Shewanella sp. D64]|uniref:hypothetical protein n=1 Tax=unclassified Shewanella TaxID=196818 RepID=UPI0022BA180F|nr:MULTISPECIES: hypothetical protein [unclassified Shewanella]MEC4729110.1 hypothetical protein [Shewanella sp. D64]MEC4740042.1 hypothetical protein [Shewanella sp. E94]WBJ95813.1 hypothetical protein HWQ47_01350 [Shewanella sp. MTB7]
MIDTLKLIDAIKKLENELRNSGKEATANFFLKAIDTIINETNNKKLKIFLELLCSSGSVSQYANFSFHEDELFDKIFEEAQKIIVKI